MRTAWGIWRGIGTAATQLALGFVLTSSVSGQGTLRFASFGDGWTAPIYDVDGKTPLTGSGFLAQLLAATPGSSLRPIGLPVPFSDTNPGYFGPVGVIVPVVPAYGTATVQVVVWRASDGPTFAAANRPGAPVGESSVFNVGPLSWLGPPPPTFPAPNLIGLQSFSLHVIVPEPSVFALGLLGGAGLVLDRRRGRGRAARPPAPP